MRSLFLTTIFFISCISSNLFAISNAQVRLNLSNIRNNITKIVLIRDSRTSYTIDLVNEIDENITITIDIAFGQYSFLFEVNGDDNYWYNFQDEKLYSENNTSNSFFSDINSSNISYDIDLNSSNFVEITSYPPEIPQIQPQNSSPKIYSYPTNILIPLSYSEQNISLMIDDDDGDDLSLSADILDKDIATVKNTQKGVWIKAGDYDTPQILQISPTHNKEGNTSLKITLSDSNLTTSINIPVSIQKGLKLEVDKSRGYPPLDVNFNATPNYNFGYIKHIRWDFKDGSVEDYNTSTLTPPPNVPELSKTYSQYLSLSHTFTKVGEYNVTCEIDTGKNYHILSSLNIAVIDSNLSTNINRGWSFISFPSYVIMHKDSIKRTFSNSSIQYIFKYTGNRWQLWDNTGKIDSTVKIDRFISLNSKEGFAIKTTSPVTIHFPIDSSKNRPNDFMKLYAKGWYLVGVNEDKNVTDILNLINNQGKNLKILYLYKDKKWYLYSPLKDIDETIGDKYPRVNKISKHDSFWIYIY